MTLADTKTDLAARLRTAMNWQNPMVDEWHSYEHLPAIIIATEGDAASEDLGGGIRSWQLLAELRAPIEAHDFLAFHRDPANRTGLAGALHSVDFNGTLVDISSTIGTEEVEAEGGRPEYIYVRCHGTLYVVDDPPPIS